MPARCSCARSFSALAACRNTPACTVTLRWRSVMLNGVLSGAGCCVITGGVEVSALRDDEVVAGSLGGVGKGISTGLLFALRICRSVGTGAGLMNGVAVAWGVMAASAELADSAGAEAICGWLAAGSLAGLGARLGSGVATGGAMRGELTGVAGVGRTCCCSSQRMPPSAPPRIMMAMPRRQKS